MATTKKTTATKKTAAKKPVAKKPTAKASAPKSAAAKTTSHAAVTKRGTASHKKAAAKKSTMRSFRISREEQAFTDFRITRQTIYWIILVAFIIFVQLWILKLQVEVVTLLDSQQNALGQ